MEQSTSQAVESTRKSTFVRVVRLSLIFLLVFSVSCLVSFAAGRHRARVNDPQAQSVAESTKAPKSGQTDDTTDGEEAKKAIYLTFDDGPGQYTEQLLDLLKKYDAKATFFTTSMYPEYAALIKREAEEGHSVAIHSYTHQYKKIYASSTAFWNDFDAQQKVIVAQTGEETKLLRFPGGSSNTVSAFSPGIMTTLTQQANAKDIAYFDWNVSSGDAGSTTDSAAVLANCKKGVQDVEKPVILCHDVKAFTVEAMKSFIPWAIENGYTFQVLTADGPFAHHKVNN